MTVTIPFLFGVEGVSDLSLLKASNKPIRVTGALLRPATPGGANVEPIFVVVRGATTKDCYAEGINLAYLELAMTALFAEV